MNNNSSCDFVASTCFPPSDLHLWYEAENEMPCVIKEEVSEEVLSHHVLSGGRKLVLHSF